VGLKSYSKIGLPSRSVIFDLDGTLIDSQESILNTIQLALRQVGVSAQIPMTKELVGPPLNEVISKITGISDKSILNEIGAKFKLNYDLLGYKESIVYPGINKFLFNLHSQGFILHIATNKRSIPTKKILEYFSWSQIFSTVYSIDSREGAPFEGKAEMIFALLKGESISSGSAVYVGDRFEDYEAATINDLRCIVVDWGYGFNNNYQDVGMRCVSNIPSLKRAIESML
jgi:phosphoglycolate phosphatase